MSKISTPAHRPLSARPHPRLRPLALACAMAIASLTLEDVHAGGYTVTTLAGDELYFRNGPVGLARYGSDTGMTRDPAGNMYIADYGNHLIRKIDTSGNVTTLAGSSYGITDGTGTAAQFRSPFAIVYDTLSSALYVTDDEAHNIRKIDPVSGIVSTLAGSSAGNSGALDGSGLAAAFNRPAGIAVDNSGTLLVADGNNCALRLVMPDGMVSTLAGSLGNCAYVDGSVSAAQFRYLGAVAYGGSAIYVSDTGNHSIRKISGGQVISIAGNGTPGYGDAIGTSAAFNSPAGLVTTPGGDIYIADTLNNHIRKIDNVGNVTTVAGSGNNVDSDGAALSAGVPNPKHLTLDVSGNALFIGEEGNGVIRRLDLTANNVSTYSGRANSYATDGTGSGASFQTPIGITIDSSGNAYISDSSTNTIRKVTPAGVVTTYSGMAGTNPGFIDGPLLTSLYSTPAGLTIDNSGNIYVADKGNHRIRKLSSTTVSTVAGDGSFTASGISSGPATATALGNPSGIAYNSSANTLYVSQPGYNCIRQINLTTGTASPLAGVCQSDSVSHGNVDAVGTTATFYGPNGLAFDNTNQVLYIADSNNHRIRQMNIATGAISSVAGDLAGASGNTDGTGAIARFNFPSELALDTSGNLLVADKGSSLIRQITPAGVVSTVAGSTAGFADGSGTASLFNSPAGVAYSNSSGHFLVVDANNARIRELAPPPAQVAPIFATVTNATRGSVVQSTAVTLNALPDNGTHPGSISCPAGDSNCGFLINGVFNSSAGFKNGDVVIMQLTAASTYSTSVSATMSIVDLAGSATFTVTTGAEPYVAPPYVPPPSVTQPPTVTQPPVETPAGTPTPVDNPNTVFSNGSNLGATVDNTGAVVLPSTPDLTLILTATTPTNVAIKPPANVPVVIANSSGSSIKLTGLSADTVVVTRKVGNDVLIEVAAGTARLEPTGANVSVPLAATAGQNVATLRPDTSGSSGSTPNSLLVRRDGQSISTFIENGKMIYVIQAGPGAKANANVFAAETANNGIAIFSGETAGFSNQGAISKIKLGSLDGDRNLPGDPLTSSDPDSALPTTAPGVIVPQLNGGLSRLDGEPVTEGIRRQLDQAFGLAGDNSSLSFDPASGVVTYRVGPVDGKTYEGRFMPVGELLVALSGFSDNGFGATNPAQAVSGAFDLSNRGVQLTLSSALGYFTELKSAVKQSDPAGSMLLQANGVLAITLKNELYFTQPGYLVQPGSVTGAPSVEMDGSGLLTFRDSKGSVQTLYPVLGDGEALKTILRAIDPQATLEPLGNGEAKATVGLQEFRLQPQYKMNPLNLPHLYDKWWLDGGYFYYTLPNGRSQAVTIK